MTVWDTIFFGLKWNRMPKFISVDKCPKIYAISHKKMTIEDYSIENQVQKHMIVVKIKCSL